MDCIPHLHVAAWHAEPGFRSATPGLEHHFLGIPRVRGVSPVTVQYSITFRF